MPFVWIPGNIQKVTVPEGGRGPWSVERFQEKAKRFGWGPSARTFTRLVHAGRGIVMSDTPNEMRDHREAVQHAHGSCLCAAPWRTSHMISNGVGCDGRTL